MKELLLTINGQPRRVLVDPTKPLLWVLREDLGLCGTKFGCGGELCGACMVHLDGQAMPSCMVSVESVQDMNITTIEGLGARGEHPLQKAWRELAVPQCGYCQSGQIMSAAALLACNACPSDQEIDQAMARNLCRCGTYGRIKRAIKDVASNSQHE
jgi:isoquinoline 1-oxidoreductase alpha subunit